MKSLLFQPNPPFNNPPDCTPGRQEVEVVIRKYDRLYRYTLRDKVTVEDPYLVLVKATAFSIQNSEPYSAMPPSRTVRDLLIRSNVTI